MKNRVTGLGGFFFKTEDPDGIKDWYKNHLGLNTDAFMDVLFGGKTKKIINAQHNRVPLKKIHSILNLVRSNL
ncbi:MAG: hypothetical protein ACI9AB_001942 [Urechidicola sp.]|jgi:hypothetical protein